MFIEVFLFWDWMEDIFELVLFFVKEICEENGFWIKEVDFSVLCVLLFYYWLGNVWEFRNVVEWMVIMSDEGFVWCDVFCEILGGVLVMVIVLGIDKIF